MSDGATAGFDPRFDPRYQRGYAGDIADERAADVETAGATDTATPTRPSVVRVPDPPTGAPEAVEAARIETMPHAEPVAADDADALLAPLSNSGELFAESAATGEPAARTWLIAGWTLNIVVFGIGLWWSWSVHSDVSYYTGGTAPTDQAFRELGWSLSPALLTGGAVGAVVVTAVAATLSRGTPPDGAGHARRRRGAAWWALIGIVAASVVTTVWLASRMVEGSAASSGLMYDGNGNAQIDEMAQLAAMAFGQFAQSAIGASAMTAIVAGVAVIAIEARRAALSAERARSALPDRP